MTRTVFLASLLLVASACAQHEKKAELTPTEGPGAPPLPKITSVTTPASSGADPRVELIVTGTARALHEAKLGPKVSGTLEAILVEEGDRVKKGQLLFRLRSSAQDLGVKQAEAALESARVMRSTAETELQRTKALLDSKSLSPAVYDQIKGRFDAADAAVRQAEAAVSSARQASVDTAVSAPFAGIIAQRRANVGETVTMMPPTTVLVLQDIDVLEARSNLPESALATVHAGSPVRVRFPAVNVSREVRVERINPSVDPITRTIEVIAHVPNADHSLKAGMLIECDFTPSVAPPADSALGPQATGAAAVQAVRHP